MRWFADTSGIARNCLSCLGFWAEIERDPALLRALTGDR